MTSTMRAGVLTEVQHDQFDELLEEIGAALAAGSLDMTIYKGSMMHLIGAVDIGNQADIKTYLEGGIANFQA